MPIENLLQEINLVATLAGILAGFAFAAVVQLLGMNPNSRLVTLTVISFTGSTLMFLYTLFTFVLIGMSTAETNQQLVELDGLGSWAFVIAIFGLMLFLAGVGLSGWIRSKATGIATSFFAFMTLCLCTWALFVAASALP